MSSRQLSSHENLSLYKADPAIVDIEALAQRQLRYMKIHAEAAEHLKTDPTRRDKAIADMKRHPQMQKECAPQLLVPFGESPDAYLDGVDAELEKIPVTFDDYVLRLHYAFAALVVFLQYKDGLLLADGPELDEKLTERVTQLHDAWIRNEFGPAHGLQVNAPTPAEPSPLTATPDPLSSRRFPTSSKPLTSAEIQKLLDTPAALLDMKFALLPDKPDGGEWEVASFTQTRTGVRYDVVFEGCDDSLPMDANELRDLLSDSRVVS